MERSLTILQREIGPNELTLINELIHTAGGRGRTYICAECSSASCRSHESQVIAHQR